MPENSTVVEAITDNIAAKNGAWVILQEKYTSMFFQGSHAHCTNLFAKAIFIDFDDFTNACKEVVKYFKNHHMDKDSFEEMQKKCWSRSHSFIITFRSSLDFTTCLKI